MFREFANEHEEQWALDLIAAIEQMHYAFTFEKVMQVSGHAGCAIE